MWMGPDKHRQYIQVLVDDIMQTRLYIPYAESGQSVTLSIKPSLQGQLLKFDRLKHHGLTLISLKKQGNGQMPAPTFQQQILEQLTVWEFDAEITVLHHATTIQAKYKAVMLSGCIQQSVQALSINKRLLVPLPEPEQ